MFRREGRGVRVDGRKLEMDGKKMEASIEQEVI